MSGPGSWLLAPPPVSRDRVMEAPPAPVTPGGKWSGDHQGEEDTECQTFMQVSLYREPRDGDIGDYKCRLTSDREKVSI